MAIFDNALFWRANQAVVLLLYAAGAALWFTGRGSHPIAILAAAIPVIHVLELPLAWARVKPRDPSVGRLVVGTLLFGFYWWIPARRGVIPAR